MHNKSFILIILIIVFISGCSNKSIQIDSSKDSYFLPITSYFEENPELTYYVPSGLDDSIPYEDITYVSGKSADLSPSQDFRTSLNCLTLPNDKILQDITIDISEYATEEYCNWNINSIFYDEDRDFVYIWIVAFMPEDFDHPHIYPLAADIPSEILAAIDATNTENIHYTCFYDGEEEVGYWFNEAVKIGDEIFESNRSTTPGYPTSYHVIDGTISSYEFLVEEANQFIENTYGDSFPQDQYLLEINLAGYENGAYIFEAQYGTGNDMPLYCDLFLAVKNFEVVDTYAILF